MSKFGSKSVSIEANTIGLTKPYFNFVDPDGLRIDTALIEPGFNILSQAAIAKGERVNLTFRFPPLPAVNGFNVFGPVRLLHLSDARGQLWMRSQLIDIPSPAEVKVVGMERFEAKGGVITLPLEARDHDVVLNFKSLASVVVNGDTRSTVAESYGLKPTVEYFVMFATAVQLLAAFISFVQYRRTQ